jgi:hypothetical protein
MRRVRRVSPLPNHAPDKSRRRPARLPLRWFNIASVTSRSAPRRCGPVARLRAGRAAISRKAASSSVSTRSRLLTALGNGIPANGLLGTVPRFVVEATQARSIAAVGQAMEIPRGAVLDLPSLSLSRRLNESKA